MFIPLWVFSVLIGLSIWGLVALKILSSTLRDGLDLGLI